MPGWVNVDRYAADADVQCSAFEMPFHNDSFDRVYMGHFLEHIEYDKIPTLLEEVQRVCDVSALVTVVGPCVDKARSTNQPEWLIEQIEANPTPEKPGIGHEWTPTTQLTIDALIAGGLEQVTEVPVATIMRPQWPNTADAPWQVAVQARTRSA